MLSQTSVSTMKYDYSKMYLFVQVQHSTDHLTRVRLLQHIAQQTWLWLQKILQKHHRWS